MEQANRSLHRQVDEYKKIVEQLKQQLFASSKQIEGDNKNKRNLLLDFGGSAPRISSKEKSNIIPASLKENYEVIDTQRETKEAFANVDLSKWLQTSIGQRDAVHKKLMSQTKQPNN